jgi:hypothetical protein
MVLMSYFDGAGQPDSRISDRIVIATACGTADQWNDFQSAWNKVLTDHEAPFLHTTDAVSLQDHFSKEKGWDKSSVDAFIEDCVSVIRDNLWSPEKSGLFVVTLTIPIADYLKAREVEPKLPHSITEICATESLSFCLRWGREIGAKYYHLYYDQGEPFFGHVDDRMRNEKAKRTIPLLGKVVHYGQSNMRDVLPLQLADLFAWCISHNNQASKPWHRRLNDLSWHSLILDYPRLLSPTKSVLDLMASWKLPKRKPTR